MFARRTVLKSVAMSSVAGLPLARILADPKLARAAADELETVSITDGLGQQVTAALAVPSQTPAGAVLVVHEWWGLNDQIKAFTGELAKQGFLGLAVDIMKEQVATTPDQASKQMQAVVPAQADATLGSWIDWLRQDARGNGKVATLGFCFGGGWSLNASLIRPVDATVIYYGNVAKKAADLATLQSPVQGHFGTLDRFINEDMVTGFEAEMTAAGKPFETHWYEANHAFANPTGGAYDADDAQLALSRSLDFLRQHIA